MAVVNILSSGSTQGHKPLKNVLDYCMQEAKTVRNGTKLVSGINCLPESAYPEMMATKKKYEKMGGREYCHILQSFSPEEDITPEKAHEIAIKFAQEQFKGYEIVVATHMDKEHIHSHIVLNSVNCETGKKYHSDKDNIKRLREASDAICLKYGLSVIENKKTELRKMGTSEYRAASKGESWKIELMATINTAMKRAKTREEFIKFMQSRGYKVTWTDSRKYITYTTPDGKRCRDNRLHLKKYTKEDMQYEFETRRRINELRRKRGEESYTGSRTDTLRDDLRRELEEHSHNIGPAVEGNGQDSIDTERTHYNRADGRVSKSDRNDSYQSREELAEGSDTGSREHEDGSYLTGWEDERDICYGIRQDQAGTEDRNAAVFGQTLSPINAPMPDYNIALSGAYLAANAETLTDPEDTDIDPTTAHIDKKEWKKIAEKNEAHGIKMGGM